MAISKEEAEALINRNRSDWLRKLRRHIPAPTTLLRRIQAVEHQTSLIVKGSSTGPAFHDLRSRQAGLCERP